MAVCITVFSLTPALMLKESCRIFNQQLMPTGLRLCVLAQHTWVCQQAYLSYLLLYQVYNRGLLNESDVCRLCSWMRIRWTDSTQAEFMLLGKVEEGGMTLLEGNLGLFDPTSYWKHESQSQLPFKCSSAFPLTWDWEVWLNGHIFSWVRSRTRSWTSMREITEICGFFSWITVGVWDT